MAGDNDTGENAMVSRTMAQLKMVTSMPEKRFIVMCLFNVVVGGGWKGRLSKQDKRKE
jgi:hypothetical protein